MMRNSGCRRFYSPGGGGGAAKVSKAKPTKSKSPKVSYNEAVLQLAGEVINGAESALTGSAGRPVDVITDYAIDRAVALADKLVDLGVVAAK